MQLYHLRYVSWLDSQLIYHAQPRVGVEGLNILAPREPYVCIGCHQDLEQEVDAAYCRERGIPVFRREVGGGAVYLDGRQIFFQLVLHRDNPLAVGDKTTLYRRMLQPVADAYADLGVPARYRPVNDVVTETGRKISGTGAAEIGEYVVLVGNLIADFDYETMSRVLRVPDEKYRDKVYRSMRENLTTLQRETGRSLGWDEMAGPLIRRFEKLLGPLEPAPLPPSVRAEVDALAPRFLGEEWLQKKDINARGTARGINVRGTAQGKKLRQVRDVKIAGGINVIQRVHKAPGGLLRAVVEIKDGRLAHVMLSGDFFCYPREAVGALEDMLEGTPVELVKEVIARFYDQRHVETPGVAISDWLAVL
jgi:lipoate-protein ligase A